MARAALSGVLRHMRRLVHARAFEDASDGQLLERFAGGEESAFAALLERHGPMVLHVCRRVLHNWSDAEDAFQATFLLLARTPRSIRRRDSIVSWLHGVACRIAMKAKVAAARRRVHEQQAMRPPTSDPGYESAWRELHSVLDEELNALPEKYRLPLILCYLEGLTHDQAAGRLGWPVGTVHSRLTRARERLRKRLTSRGLTLAAGPFAVVLAANAASGAVPAVLGRATTEASLLLACGKLLGAKVSAPVVTLMDAAAKSSSVIKLKTVTMLFVGLCVLGAGAGVVAQRALTAQESKAQPTDGPIAVAQGTEPAKKEQPKADAPQKPRLDRYGDPLPPGAIARLGTLRLRHGKAGIAAIALSPDSKTITSAGGDGSIVLHDATTGEKLRSLAGEPSSVTVFAPDGQSLATVVGDRRVSVREVATGKGVSEFQIERPVRTLAFSSDGRMLAGGEDHLIHVWDVRAGKETSRITSPGIATRTLALSPDGKTLATAGGEREQSPPMICLWEAASGRKLRQWQPHADKGQTHALAFSPDGKRLASASVTDGPKGVNALHVWAVPACERQLEVPGEFNSLRFSPCGKVLAAVGADMVSLRDPDTGKEIRRIPASGLVSFAADGKSLALAGHTISFWDVTTGRQLRPPFPGHGGCVRSVHFLGGGEAVASLGDDASYLWQVRTARNIGRLEGSQISSAPPALSRDGKTLAVMGWERTPASRRVIRLWDTTAGRKLRDLEPPASASLTGLGLSPDGKNLGVAIWDRTIQFWDVGTGKPLHALALPNVSAESLAFSPDGKALAVGDGLFLRAPNGKVPTIRMLNASTGRELCKPLELPETAAAKKQSARVVNMGPVAFSADGKVLAAALMSGGNWGREHVLQVWEVATGQVLCRLERVSNRFALSPDGKSLVTMLGDPGFDESPRLWEVATGKLRGQIRGHLGSILTADFSADGRFLATGSQDTTILIWDALNLTGERLAAAKLSPKQLEALWADLAGSDAAKAYRAIGAQVAAPEQAVPFLRQHLRPVPAVDSKHLARLVADLDSNQFDRREKASKDLEVLADEAEPALRKTLASRPSAEVRRRVELLLEKLERGIPPGTRLQQLRAIEVLEHIGTPEAQGVLKVPTKGSPEARLTREAKASLERIGRRKARE